LQQSRLRRAVEAARTEALCILAKTHGNLRDGQAHGQDRHALLAADAKRGGRRDAMPDRRVRPLHGCRAQLGEADSKVFALVVERSCRPRPRHHIERFGHALARVIASEAVTDELVLVEDRAPADADIESPTCEVVKQGQLGREPHRMAQCHLYDRETDADALRAHGGERRQTVSSA
jgi:hypothetical protein